MQYLVKTPWWMKKLVPGATWSVDTQEPLIYLSFDDGPHPDITPKVLDILNQYHARASFFCVGANVQRFPDVYRKIIDAGHAVGNHTYHHLNGWRTKDKKYMDDIALAAKYIDSRLFRPPYGRLGLFQRKLLAKPAYDMKVVMWSVLSGDFDPTISPEQCLDHVLLNTGAGDIVVFHDSEKAANRMLFALPRVLEYFSEKGFRFERLQL